ncbi:hypothetical protein [Flavobacterium granuli]|uniref:Cytochrome C and Quinol oxidase polypeptide I n=1 Tax=Flavobacterium granuli TaxID=280093 RepID=A0A1M5S3J1_9FLAO|nr:hypothetical protein [Flavobacterium granuli]PRZ21195.1 hypothetical protein BC624_10948 [Flavobacterium granuli]SHH33000.1 hypothetical protein SAMN05443373_11148 [Flavobacterium granuli]
MKQHWLVTCFVNFFIASVMGLLLRLMYVTPVEWINFQFLLHGHSHVAMLGWVYLMLYSLIVHFFLNKEAQQKAVYNRLFWVTQFSVIGMMFRFPVEGYALFSIAFSTLHIFCSYIFCRRIWKDAQPSSLSEEKLLRAALVFMVVSTVGVWCLGPAVGLLGKASAFYQIAIQFFLHFQFNGWFLFAVLALFFNQLKAKIDEKNFQLFYSLLIASTILTLALPVSWYLDNPVFYWINALGVTLQLVAFGVFIKIIKPKFHIFFSTLKRIEKLIYGFALLSLGLKVGIQMVALLPGLDQVSHQIRNFVIGYIHLTMLGIISGFLLGFTLQNKFLNGTNIWVSLGLKIFLAGFVATEMLLFMQGAYLFFGLGEFPMYHQNLFIASIGLPTGLIILIISLFQSAERIKIIARD